MQVRQICIDCECFFLTSSPPQYTSENFSILKAKKRKQLLAEGFSKTRVKKEIKKLTEEENKRGRCEKCQQIVEKRQIQTKKGKWARNKAKREKKKAEELRIVKIEESLNYIRKKLEEDKTLTDKVEYWNQINEISSKIREEQKKEEENELEKAKETYLNKKNYWHLPLTEKQKEKIGKETNATLLEDYVRQILKNHDQIKELVESNIYTFNSWKHYVGWPVFLILGSVAAKKIRKIIKKKSKPTTNLQEEVQEKFSLWRMNMILSVVGYGVIFFLLKDAINKWLRPNIYRLLETNENVTTVAVTSMLGLLFLADGIITSELKTPLQRLSIKIENADISEKEKKSLLSKTQQSNETFKETLKRFGLLSIAGIAIKLLGDAFDKNPLSLLCYVVPLAFGGWRIWEVSKKIKKSSWGE